jgi:hypothetical protein
VQTSASFNKYFLDCGPTLLENRSCAQRCLVEAPDSPRAWRGEAQEEPGRHDHHFQEGHRGGSRR